MSESPKPGDAGSDRSAIGAKPGETLDYGPRSTSETGVDPSVAAAASAETVDKPPETADKASFSLSPGIESVSGEGRVKSVSKSGPHQVAGYEILEVLGRGSMGVVYKALQPGLKRVVALKMILAGDHADDHDLARFHTEAEAAAQLQNPHIVQVYEVGEQDGLPFLSQEYVNGGSLKARLGGKPQPVQAAGQMVQVLAQAMDFAHKQGIVHRDLKPANVMLMVPRDSGSTEASLTGAPLVQQLYGIPKIADFGLAKRLAEESGQTRSGTILGTPSYMAPEQAEGRSKEVGPLADQYSLGAILYELLTGRPPFNGATLWETIEQVRSQEPVPPSRLQPKVPRDLETICLKCLQKEPAKRYVDTAALAEDLRRFVAGETIKARPVSTGERLLRWCRRNPRVAALLGLVVVLVTAGLVGLSYFNIRLSKEIKEKEEQRQAADAAKNAAVDAKNVAMDQRGLAINSLKSVVTRINDQLKGKPGLDKLRKDILKTALDDLDKVATNVEVTLSMADSAKAVAHLQLGYLFQDVGENKKAFDHIEQGYEILHKMARQEPRNDLARANMTLFLRPMGFLLLKMKGNKAAARDKFLQAKEILEEIDRNPKDGKLAPQVVKRLLAEICHSLGTVTIDNNPAEAQYYYQTALQQRLALAKQDKNNSEAELAVANSYLMVGGASFWLGKEAAARRYYDQALEIYRRRAKENTANLGIQKGLGFALQRLGDLELRTKRLEQAAEDYGAAKDIYARLTKEDPSNVGYQEDLARAYYDLGTAAACAKNPTEAEKNFRESLATRQKRADADPDDVALKKDLMITLARAGDHKQAAKIAEEIRRLPEDGGSLVEVAGCYALCVLAVSRVKQEHNSETDVLRKDYADQAIRALQQAVTQGYRNVVNLKTEPDLDAIREQPEFKALLENVQNPRPGKS
jgi:serine/threonine-protein kinase